MATAHRIPKTVRDWQEYLGNDKLFNNLDKLIKAENINFDLDAAAEALDGDARHQQQALKTLLEVRDILDRKTHPKTIEPTKAEKKTSARRAKPEKKSHTKKERVKNNPIRNHIITRACAAVLRQCGKTINKIPKQERMGVFKDFKWSPKFTNPFHHTVGETTRNMYGIHGVPFFITQGLTFFTMTASALTIGAFMWGTDPADQVNITNFKQSSTLTDVSLEGQVALSSIDHPVEYLVAQGLLKEFKDPSQQNGLAALINATQEHNVPIIIPATFMKIESDFCLNEQSVKSANTPQGCFQFSKNRWLETLWYNANVYPEAVLQTPAGNMTLKEIQENHLKRSGGVIRVRNEANDQFIVDLRYDAQAAADVKVMEIKRKYPDIVMRYQYEDTRIVALKNAMIDHHLGNAFKHVALPVWNMLEETINSGNSNERYDQALANLIVSDAMSIYQDHQQGASGSERFNSAAFGEQASDASKPITSVMSYVHAESNPLFYRNAHISVGEAKSRMENVVRGVINTARRAAAEHATPTQLLGAQEYSRFNAFIIAGDYIPELRNIPIPRARPKDLKT